MKNVIKILFIALLITNISCDSDADDHITGDAASGGALVKVMPSEGKALGVPVDRDDLDNTIINFADVKLDLNIQLQFGGQDVTKYEIIKTFLKNGEDELPSVESVVATGTNLPLNVTYATIDDFMSGTGITNPDDVRIGDQFIFRTKMYTSDGVYYARKGTYSVTVNCSSDLAGGYHINYTSGLQEITITEIGPGKYRSSYLPTFSNEYWFEFEDVCSSLIITDWEYQGGNPITPLDEVVGFVAENGDLTFEGINVAGVSWYVGKDFTIYKN